MPHLAHADGKSIPKPCVMRPAQDCKGKNMAIAEWPTKSGPADYALFTGTKCIGVIGAKRRNKNVSSHIDQAQRYARGFRQFAGLNDSRVIEAQAEGAPL